MQQFIEEHIIINQKDTCSTGNIMREEYLATEHSSER